MTLSTFTANATPKSDATDPGYLPGVCNIGPEEIARRRRAGHMGVAAAVIVLAVLIGVGAPPLLRLIVALPAAAAASGYLQAVFRFCAKFGSRGEFNFGPLGTVGQVEDTEARHRDRVRSMQILLASLAIGIAVGAAAVVLPL
jgi:hypothetical protein